MGARVYGSNRQPLRLGAVGPGSVYNSDFGEQSEERDSQVLQRVQARERLLGHGADLVPLQEPGGKKKNTKQARSVSDLAGETSRHRRRGNLQLLQLLQRGERPVHVFDGPGDLVPLEVPLATETKKRPRC